ncbi:undecaprenyldiphospho-muramoylpentapeptide beta-N-acetylglucosaminyltransferase [Roseomonas fluvialis]|uniref:UDP-N-acetylglucosamine--N-acetylmuramyl-(pentapeptide) pyrophosphoryl-undecaprenol N-acetylglucosamine transferase n=1 Tax=Roseomonas fluvialis TaxID=1750527 RepID=A0ABM7Y028_9PROT|nr:undecaprenyldiphospho-muramoylpentapeptide beta-N-acetylglucosaminyltransferase [Roseomonas fluvialis]BDG71114.1 UDP-N-acetylglucosamine--N-acetylmuramyl-(pentapeptide) pyrophosphoryl-undecaprenol N-acetylglucosamine transferase [Roseomonas fluvialis]
MRGPAVRPIIIAAGGTGGHLFPAEALAAELLRRGERIALMTDARSAAYDSAAFANAERFVLRGGGLSGRGLRGAASGAMALVAGTAQARRHLAALQPSAVVGFGGYASFPPLAAARLMAPARRPAIVLHEQNAVLGRANRLMARVADLLALSFPNTSQVPAGATVAMVGNPVRPALAALAGQPYPLPPDGGALRLLVTGGSQGARIFADVVPPAIAALPEAIRARLLVTQQCRAEDLARTETAYRDAGVVADLAPFFPDIAGRLATAHLVIARAGASTISELECAGRPSILVPLPSAIDDHQNANARALAEADAAWVYPQTAFTPGALAERLVALFAFPARLQSAAVAASALARPHAARDLADRVLALVRQPAMGAA